MKFEDALAAMREGKKVKLPDWCSPIEIKTTHTIVWCHDNGEVPFIGDNAMMREDWEIYNADI